MDISDYKEELKNKTLTEESVSDFFDTVTEIILSDRVEIITYIKLLYEHLLKYQYQPERQTRSWVINIRNACSELIIFKIYEKNIWDIITDKDYIWVYTMAVKRASSDTGILANEFPKEIPDEYNIEYLLTDDNTEKFLKKYAYTKEAKNALPLYFKYKK